MLNGMLVADARRGPSVVVRRSRADVEGPTARSSIQPLMQVATRSASCTPRRWMPMIAKLSAAVCSTISCAMRHRALSLRRP